jgi:hypothetical protein
MAKGLSGEGQWQGRGKGVPWLSGHRYWLSVVGYWLQVIGYQLLI